MNQLINYKIGDTLVSKDSPYKEIGVCTGFRHNNTCVDIDGKCWGGAQYFMKSELSDFQVLDSITIKNQTELLK